MDKRVEAPCHLPDLLAEIHKLVPKTRKPEGHSVQIEVPGFGPTKVNFMYSLDEEDYYFKLSIIPLRKGQTAQLDYECWFGESGQLAMPAKPVSLVTKKGLVPSQDLSLERIIIEETLVALQAKT